MSVPKRRFGWTGVDVPVIGQGTWMMEGSPRDEQRAIQALQLGLDLGLTHVDTAEMYGSGRVEELVGEAIEGRRDEVFLVSKVLPSNASYRGTVKACERSLKRLGTDWLDLYLLHWPGAYPLAETMRALEDLVDAGQIRYLGISNFDVGEVQAAEQSLKRHRLACNQVLYHLGDRGIERRLIPYCRQREIAVVAYSPFGHNEFPRPKSAGGQMLAEVGSRHGHTPRQVVLNFLTRHEGIFTIPKSADPDHVRENAAGAGWALDPGDFAAIDRVFPAPSHDVPLGVL